MWVETNVQKSTITDEMFIIWFGSRTVQRILGKNTKKEGRTQR
jgi:hypothetical protein